MVSLTVEIVLYFAFPFLIAGQLKWEKINATNGPSRRRDVAIGYDSTNKSVLIFGGRGDDVYNDTWALDLNTYRWRKLPTVTGIGKRFSVVSGVWNGGFYVSTGQFGDTFFDDLWCLNLTTFVWKKLPQKGHTPEERYGASGGIFPDKNSSLFYLTHGFAGKRYSNTFVYDVSTKEGWKEIFEGTHPYNPNLPHARCLHSGTMLSSQKLVLYGGCMSGGGTGGPCPADDSWTYDATKQEWTRLPDCASPRKYSAMALLPIVQDKNGMDVIRAVLYGGDETGRSVISVKKSPPNEVVIFNPQTEEWAKKTVDGEVPPKRSGHAMVTVDNGIIMFGGSSSDGNLNDVWLLKGTAIEADKTQDGEDCHFVYFSFIQLHGIFMFIGWDLLLQMGMFFARYFRHKDPWWFKMHRAMQVSGLVFAFLGLVFAIVSVLSDHFNFVHGGLGLVIMLIGLAQPLNAFFRPHKSEPKSLKRKIWEIFHINAGRLALVLALINTSLGVFLAVVPYAAWVAWFVMFGLWFGFLLLMEIRLQYTRYSGRNNSIEMNNR